MNEHIEEALKHMGMCAPVTRPATLPEMLAKEALSAVWNAAIEAAAHQARLTMTIHKDADELTCSICAGEVRNLKIEEK